MKTFSKCPYFQKAPLPQKIPGCMPEKDLEFKTPWLRYYFICNYLLAFEIKWISSRNIWLFFFFFRKGKKFDTKKGFSFRRREYLSTKVVLHHQKQLFLGCKHIWVSQEVILLQHIPCATCHDQGYLHFNHYFFSIKCILIIETASMRYKNVKKTTLKYCSTFTESYAIFKKWIRLLK